MSATADPLVAIVGGEQTFVAQALGWMLSRGGCRVTGVYASGGELCAALRSGRRRPRAALVYADSEHAPPHALAELKLAHPELKVLLLCHHATPEVVRYAIEERAEGVVLTSDTVEEAIFALHQVLEGRAVMPAGWHSRAAPDGDPLAELSAREREILALVAAGMSNKQIAAHLTISSNTVKFHLRTIYAKLGVTNRVQATQSTR